jgi:hypothetical protein
MSVITALSGRIYRKAVDAIDRIALVGAEDRPVFVGGAPRSGTTLFRTMLNAHPDIAIPRETKLVVEAWRHRVAFGDLKNADNCRELTDWILNDYETTRFKRLKVDVNEARARMLAAPPTIGSVVGTGLALYSEKHGAKRWGDKRPMNIQWLPAIVAMFPDMQFIHLVRDPRAVVASMRKLGWLDDWYDGTVVGGVDLWVRSIRFGRRARARYRADQFLQLRYEDLIADTEGRLQVICDFAGLSTAHLEDMLSFHLKPVDIPRGKREKYHPLLAQPITSAAVRAWTEQLNEGEVAFIEKVAARHLEHFGYEPEAKGVAVPAELERAWEARGGKRRDWPRARSLKYPHPVAARLTKAQVRRAELLRLGRKA